MPTPAEQAWIDAINAGHSPTDIQNYSNAVGGGIPQEVAANPSAYGYDYGGNPLGQIPGAPDMLGQRNLAFGQTNSYDYRTDPSYLALQRAYGYQESQAQADAAHNTGNLDVLQPITEDDIQANQGEALRQADLSAEARGIYQSGERLTNRGRIAGDYGRQLSAVQLTGAMQRGNIQYDLAKALGAVTNNRADTESQYATPPLPQNPAGSY